MADGHAAPIVGTVVVNGGTGTAGRFVVAQALNQGRRVVVPARSERSAARLRDFLEAWPGAQSRDLTALAIVPLGPDGDPYAAVRDAVSTSNPGAGVAVVSALGGFSEGEPLASMATGRWTDVLASNLTSHFVAARECLALLSGESPALLLLNGIAGREVLSGSGPTTVAGHGQTVLLQTFAHEAAEADATSTTRFVELFIHAPIDRAFPDEPAPTSKPVAGDVVATEALTILDAAGPPGYAAVDLRA